MEYLAVVHLLNNTSMIDSLEERKNDVLVPILINAPALDPHTSCVTPITLARMLISSGSLVGRRRTARPVLRAVTMLAWAYAAAVMIPNAPARVVLTRAKLYEPREMSLAAKIKFYLLLPLFVIRI